MEVLKESPVPNHVNVVHDGVDAIAFLRREPPHRGVPRPELILLDLNLPKMSGRSVLAEIEAGPRAETDSRRGPDHFVRRARYFPVL